MNISKNKNILVITPATIRPEIFDKTLNSFFGKCFRHNGNINYQIALHVDCVGDHEEKDIHEIFGLAEIYFGTERIWYFGTERDQRFCSLSRSFYNLWFFASASLCDYVFYLEDDWLLLENIDMGRLIQIMDNNPNLATLRLNRFKSGAAFAKQWKHWFRWNGQYFECQEKDKAHIGWCGHPGLVRKEFIIETLPLLRDDQCPERQMKGIYGPTKMRDIIMKWDYGVFSNPNRQPLIADIGRVWRSQRNIIKLKDTSWVKGKEK